ncbi:hypothetical protein C0J52_23544 [Blattella germanica]|nr:hypothetical protein C0J52_23544 [Blattella germanica]
MDLPIKRPIQYNSSSFDNKRMLQTGHFKIGDTPTEASGGMQAAKISPGPKCKQIPEDYKKPSIS